MVTSDYLGEIYKLSKQRRQRTVQISCGHRSAGLQCRHIRCRLCRYGKTETSSLCGYDWSGPLGFQSITDCNLLITIKFIGSTFATFRFQWRQGV